MSTIAQTHPDLVASLPAHDQYRICVDPSTRPDELMHLLGASGGAHTIVRELIAVHPNATVAILRMLSEDPVASVREAARASLDEHALIPA